MDAPKHHHRAHHRSPRRSDPARHSRSRRRSASPDRDRERSHRHRHEAKRTRSPSPSSIALPFNAPPITRHAFSLPHVRDIFANYLHVQKDLILDELDAREAKGRFKRFVSHYNRGELARGWYERVSQKEATIRPDVKEREEAVKPERKKARLEQKEDEEKEKEKDEEDESEDEVVGPFLPGHEPAKRAVRPGPAIPTVEDLDFQREILDDDAELARADLRFSRKQDRKSQLAALDELVPRADAGTHERRLEKKKEVNDKMRSFREKSPDVELDDNTLMGGGEGGTEGFKQKKAALERKKNDRELRKEQLLRARIAEREERLQMHRVKEERTMAMLKTLATRFH